MENNKWIDTPIEFGTKLSKEDKGPIVNSTLYKKLVGSLMYLIATRPNISYAVSYISRFSESPKDFHWKAGKRILRYITGTITHGLWYTTSVDSTLMDFTDSDFAGDITDRKNTSRSIFCFVLVII